MGTWVLSDSRRRTAWISQPQQFSYQMDRECHSSSHANSCWHREKAVNSPLDSHGAGNSTCLLTEQVVSSTQKAVACTLDTIRLWDCPLPKLTGRKDKTNSSKRPTRCSTLERVPSKWR